MAAARRPRRSPGSAVPRYLKVRERDRIERATGVYRGRGTLDIAHFFRHERLSHPALLLTYKLPPGGSEGMHTHGRKRRCGSYDEFYFVISGSGCMIIDGESVPVRAGDYIYVGNGAAHELRNTSRCRSLKVHLVAIYRAFGVKNRTEAALAAARYFDATP